MSDTEPHSQLYFTDARDHWWSAEFVAWIAQRLRLDRVRTLLDVGAGQGHFSRMWAPYLATDFEVVCVDPEERSLAVAKQRNDAMIARQEIRGRFRYVAGRAEALPFPDGGFDAVICQTVLIHLHDPAVGVAEMTRVVRGGGLVLAAEPDNLAGVQEAAALGPEFDPDKIAQGARFQSYCVRGKHRLGLGWNNAGVHLPRWLARLRDVQYFQDHRPRVMAPPYTSASERTDIADLRSAHQRGIAGWPREEARRYFLAGGGREESFDAEYDAWLAIHAEQLAQIDAGSYWMVSGVALFIAAGVKP